jgi:hypothetical protein
VQLLSRLDAISPQEGMKKLAEYTPRFKKLMSDLACKYGLTILAGGAVAGGVHAAAAMTRVKSTAFTGGTANPVLSVIEDVFAFVSLIAALLLPILVLAVIVLLAWWFRRRWRGRRKPDPAMA